MPDLSTLAVFALSTVGLLLIPGPTVMFIVARSVELGRTAGFVSMLGVEAGALLHVAVATLGLSALVASSPTAFAILKYAGGAYLIALGVSRLRRLGSPDEVTGPRAGHRTLFSQGVVIDLLNPKTALFFLAFLPQFIEPGHGSAATQIAILGGLFVLLAAINDSVYVVAGSVLGSRIKRNARARRRVDTGSACVYLALGGLATAAG